MAVPYIFATATNTIPLANLDSNFSYFADAITVSSGNVIIGTTAIGFAEKFRVYGNYSVFDNGTYTGFIGAGNSLGTATSTDFAFRSSNAMAFLTGGATERMRIDSSGNVIIGATSAGSRFFAKGGSIGQTVSQKVAFDTNTTTMDVWERSDGAVSCKLVYDGSGLINFGTSTAHPLTFLTSNIERMRIDSSGNLLVGSTTSNAFGIPTIEIGGASGNGLLTIRRNVTTAAGQIVFYNPNGTVGSVITTGTTTAFNTTSDYRLKTNVTPIKNALSIIDALNPINFTWIDGRKDDGFLAHEIQAIIPNCVTGEKDAINKDGTPKYQQMDNSGVIPFLVKAIQELKAEIDKLKGK